MKNLTLLYPTDLSDFSRTNLQRLLPVIRSGNNRLILLHAGSHTKSQVEHDRVRIKEAFAEFCAALPELKDLDYETRWEFGISSEVILNESDKVEVDMVIMATHGAKGWEQFWGSKTQAVVQRSITPVLVVPEGASLVETQTIVLAADYEDELSENKLYPLKLMADHLKTEIDIVTINRKESELSRPEKRNRKALRNQLRQWPHRFSHHFEEEIHEGLIKYAEKQNAGLIAVIPKTYGFLEKLFTESISQKMVYQSTIPLLILV